MPGADITRVINLLDPKDTCRVATTGAVNLSIAPPASIDGVTLNNRDRVLVWQNGPSSQNGIYVVDTVNGLWARAQDANSNSNFTQGLFTFVALGTLHGQSVFLCPTQNPNIGVTGLVFVKIAQKNGIGLYVPLAGTSALMGGPVTGNVEITDTFGFIGVGNGLFIKFNTDRITLLSNIIKGTGEIQSAGVGNGAVVGNARGTGAIDLQTLRSAAGQVASGAYSAILGGQGNTASGQQSVIGGGISNIASALNSFVGGGSANTSTIGYSAIMGGFANGIGGNGTYSVICGGNTNVISETESFIGGGAQNNITSPLSVICGGLLNQVVGLKSFVGGGQENAATGFQSNVVGGQLNFANADHSSILGGTLNQTAALNDYSIVLGGLYTYGDRAYSRFYGADQFSVLGGTQAGGQMQSRSTTDATPTVLFADGNSASAYFTMPINDLVYFEARINAIQIGGIAGTVGDCACWVVKGLLKNIGGTTSLVGALSYETALGLVAVSTQRAGDAGAAAWTIAVAAVDSPDTLQITATGEADKTIKWTADIYANETRY